MLPPPFLEQRFILDSSTRVKVLSAGRRWGKSLLCHMLIERQPMDSDILYVVPDHTTRVRLVQQFAPLRRRIIVVNCHQDLSGLVHYIKDYSLVILDEPAMMPTDIQPIALGERSQLLAVGTIRNYYLPDLLKELLDWAVCQPITRARAWMYHKSRWVGNIEEYKEAMSPEQWETQIMGNSCQD